MSEAKNNKIKIIFDEKLKVFKEIEYTEIIHPTSEQPTGFYKVEKETIITKYGIWLDDTDNQQIFNDWINSFFYNNTVNMPYVFLFTDFHSPEKTFIFSRSLTSNLIIDYKKTFKPIYDTEDIDQDGNTREVIKSSIVVGVEDTIQQLGYVNTSPSLITDQNKNDNANIPVPHLTIPIVSKEDSQEFFMYLIPMDEHCYKIEK